jgi:hypothetical protein
VFYFISWLCNSVKVHRESQHIDAENNYIAPSKQYNLNIFFLFYLFTSIFLTTYNIILFIHNIILILLYYRYVIIVIIMIIIVIIVIIITIVKW